VFESISVRELYPDVTEISWETTGSLATVAFIVERSENPIDCFEEVSEPLAGETSGFSNDSFIDETFRNYSKHRILYYRVKAINWQTNDFIEYSRVEHSRAPRDFVAMEIARRNNLVLRRFVGVPGYIYIAKTYGQKCECWDHIKGRQKRSHCDSCYGTGYTGGFCAPVPIFLCPNIEVNKTQIVDFGELQPHERDGWIGHFPLARPRDLLFTQQKRYRVEQKQNISQKDSVVMQMIRLTELNKSDIEYKIETPSFDLFTEDDLVIRVYGGSSGAYFTTTDKKYQDDIAGYDPTPVKRTLKVDGIEEDTEIGDES